MTTYARVAQLWTGQRWARDATLAIDDSGIRPADGAAPAAAHLDATILPPLTDAHVHIGLSDFATHGGRTLARVVDLGWSPLSIVDVHRTEVVWAGRFLTAPGGYPSTRGWAPPESVREITDPRDAEKAVREMVDLGAAVIKVTLNTDAGPVLPDAELASVVAAAHEHGLRVVAHVEGPGQPQRAAAAGVDCFAHAPWTETLPDSDLRSMVGMVGWISTLDMHGRGRYGTDYDTAVDNLGRFAALGGNVIYGTDLGNAIAAAELNLREIAALRAAGLTGSQVLRALGGSPLLPTWSRTATLLPGPVDDEDAAILALADATPVDPASLLERLT